MTKILATDPSEKEWMENVIAVARMFGFIVYHTNDSRRSAPGFPDLILIKGRYLLAIELKVGANKPTAQQLGWLKAFAGVKEVRSAVWNEQQKEGIYANLSMFAHHANDEDQATYISADTAADLRAWADDLIDISGGDSTDSLTLIAGNLRELADGVSLAEAG